MIATRWTAIVAVSFAMLAPGCGRYGPPIRALPSHPAAVEREPFDDTRDEAVPYVLEGLRGAETDADADETMEAAPATPEADRKQKTKPPE